MGMKRIKHHGLGEGEASAHVDDEDGRAPPSCPTTLAVVLGVDWYWKLRR